MALIGNYSIYNKTCGRWTTAATAGGEYAQSRANFGKWSQRRFFLPDMSATANYKTGMPEGYSPTGGAWVWPVKAGSLSSVNNLNGVGAFTSSIAGGKNATATLAGVGAIATAALALIVPATATLSGSGSVTPLISALGNVAASASGSGSMTASIKALGNVVATLVGEGDLTSTASALGNMGADITVTGVELTTANVAAYVWNAVASEFNNSGTMGRMQNDMLTSGLFIALKD